MSAFPTTAVPEIASDVLQGLTRHPKSLPPRLLYDAQGSLLFEEITRLPEYYLTRTEQTILSSFSRKILQAAGENLSVVELGAGSARKTQLLIAALLKRQLRVRYYPIDVSRSALRDAAERLTDEFEYVSVHPIAADYTQGMAYLSAVRGRKLVLYLGSSIGNFEPAEAAALLRMLRLSIEPGDALLLGTDMVKPVSVLIPAYDDAQGVTARFNKNLLARINRELDANFDPDAFRHVARWDQARSRMEMHLESVREQMVAIRALDLLVGFVAGERIHTESSYKYTLPMVRAMLEAVRSPASQSGFALERTWMDRRRWFSLHLLRAL